MNNDRTDWETVCRGAGPALLLNVRQLRADRRLVLMALLCTLAPGQTEIALDPRSLGRPRLQARAALEALERAGVLAIARGPRSTEVRLTVDYRGLARLCGLAPGKLRSVRAA